MADWVTASSEIIVTSESLYPRYNVTQVSSNATVVDVFYEYVIIATIWRVIAPLWLALGTAGNLLALVVLRRPALAHMSIAPYLVALSLADMWVLYVGLLPLWFEHAFGMVLSLASTITCKLQYYCIYVGACACTWIVAIVSVERCVCVWLPHRSRLVRQRHRIVVLVVMLLTALLFNAHIFYGFHLKYQINESTKEAETHCQTVDVSYWSFFYFEWTIVSLIATGIGPFAVILFSSLAIVGKLLFLTIGKKARVHPQISNSDSTSENVTKVTYDGRKARLTLQKTKSFNRNDSFSVALERINEHRRSTLTRWTAFTRQAADMRSTTILLMVVNAVFLVTTGPFQILLVGWPYLKLKATPAKLAKMDLTYTLLLCLAYINNIANFGLYCLSGPLFRKTFLSMFKRSRRTSGPAESGNRITDITSAIEQVTLADARG